MKILVTGSTAYDLLLGYDGSFHDSLHESSQAMTAIYLTSRFARHHGGTAANIAWNLALLGSDPLMVSTVGKDGAPYKELLRDRGVDVSHLEQINDDVTSTAIIGTDNNGNQVGFFHAGADTHGTWPAYAKVSAGRPNLCDEADDISYAIISPRDESLMLKAVDYCKTYAIKYFFDPGQRISSMNSDDMRRCIQGAYGIIANEYEWEVIKDRLGYTPQSVLADAEHLIVTRGANGASHFTDGQTQNVGGCTADKLVNPTGAGDAFRAGLLHGLGSNWSMRDSMRLGCAMGSVVVELEGTLPDSLDMGDIGRRAEEAYGEKLNI